jgi:hypothetical protein
MQFYIGGTKSSTGPHNKNLEWVKLGDLGGHETWLLPSINFQR